MCGRRPLSTSRTRCTFRSLTGCLAHGIAAKLFPGLQDILGDQPPQVLSMMKELIPKIVRQLNLVAKPDTRLDLLYKTYGFCFQSRGQQDAGVVGLALCISRQANLLTCTPDVPTV